MYAPSFAYHRASSVADAQRLLAANPGAKLLAGGHSLLPMLKLRLAAPTALIDIGRIAELRERKIEQCEERARPDADEISRMTMRPAREKEMVA